MFVFLRQVRSTFIIALTIPFSLILAGAVMYFLHYTINVLTLFAFIVVLGMVVDSAIVILENISRHREQGESQSEGAIYGASEVAMAVTVATLTTLCVFFPLIFVRGITQVLFKPFAVVAGVVLLASLFSALTLTPMLASRILPAVYVGRRSQNAFFRLSEAGFERIASAYSSFLDWALHHRGAVLFVALVFFAGSLSLVPVIGWEFMPREDVARVTGTLELPVGTRVEKTAEVMEWIAQVLREEIPEEDRLAVFTRCSEGEGMHGGLMGGEGSHIGTFGVRLVPREHRDEDVWQIADRLRKRIEEVRGLYSVENFSIELSDPMEGFLMGGEKPLSVNILGDDMELTDRLALMIKQKVEAVPGAVDISISREKGAPELWLEVERDKASLMGLNVSQVADAVRAGVYGQLAGKYRVRGDEYDIFVRLREEDRAVAEDLERIPLRLPTGQIIRAGNVARVKFARGPLQIERKDQNRIVRVGGDSHRRSLGRVTRDVQKAIAEIDVPPGVEVKMGGQSKDIREAFFWLTIALAVGIILIYMVMASQFESLVDPFVVMFSVPFAFTGVMWALFLGGHNLSVIVFLGMLMLIGVVVNNAIVLVDYINVLRERGRSMEQAVREGGRTRLRPVLMTAFTTIMALLPMALRRGQGSETWNPLGLTILGGLLVATLVTLVLVPVMYSLFEAPFHRA